MKVRIGEVSEYKNTVELIMKCGFGERRNQTIHKKAPLQSASVSCLTSGYVHLTTQIFISRGSRRMASPAQN